MNIELEKFANACIAKGRGEESGSIKADGIYYKRIRSVYDLLKEDNRLHELLELLEHENPYVRSWAAGYTLQIDPAKSEQTLEEVANIKGRMVAFSAEMTLKEWRKGNLKFD
ncbi:MAG: DUF2019 domain-containing protein [Candidatus Bathyarchaeota archaeon]|nr:DUF2019 domain-containing protein [Candidatus Termitimicrobium sp.]